MTAGHGELRSCAVADVTWVRAGHVSALGEIACAWSIGEGRFRLEVDVPLPAGSAIVRLPDGQVVLVQAGHRVITCAWHGRSGSVEETLTTPAAKDRPAPPSSAPASYEEPGGSSASG